MKSKIFILFCILGSSFYCFGYPDVSFEDTGEFYLRTAFIDNGIQVFKVGKISGAESSIGVIVEGKAYAVPEEFKEEFELMSNMSFVSRLPSHEFVEMLNKILNSQQ